MPLAGNALNNVGTGLAPVRKRVEGTLQPVWSDGPLTNNRVLVLPLAGNALNNVGTGLAPVRKRVEGTLQPVW